MPGLKDSVMNTLGLGGLIADTTLSWTWQEQFALADSGGIVEMITWEDADERAGFTLREGRMIDGLAYEIRGLQADQYLIYSIAKLKSPKAGRSPPMKPSTEIRQLVTIIGIKSGASIN